MMSDSTPKRRHVVLVEHTSSGRPVYVCEHGVAWSQSTDEALDLEVHTDPLTSPLDEVDDAARMARRRVGGAR